MMTESISKGKTSKSGGGSADARAPGKKTKRKTNRKSAAAKTSGKADQTSAGQPDRESGQRERMIAEAAYFRAQQRGFSNGDMVADWLAAEQEVDQRLRSTGEVASGSTRKRTGRDRAKG